MEDFIGTLSEKLIDESKANPGPFDANPFLQTFSPALDSLLSLRSQMAERTKRMESDVRRAEREYGKRLRELDGGFEVGSSNVNGANQRLLGARSRIWRARSRMWAGRRSGLASSSNHCIRPAQRRNRLHSSCHTTYRSLTRHPLLPTRTTRQPPQHPSKRYSQRVLPAKAVLASPSSFAVSWR